MGRKLIIAGGRNYSLTLDDESRLDSIGDVELVISGGATGVDRGGEGWAASRQIPLQVVEADWAAHGRAAGPIRNREMASIATAVALFPGGRGTESMFNEATKASLEIFDFRRASTGE